MPTLTVLKCDYCGYAVDEKLAAGWIETYAKGIDIRSFDKFKSLNAVICSYTCLCEYFKDSSLKVN